ncbi:MAG: chemotaxis protein, partial [Bacteroidota bacterium]
MGNLFNKIKWIAGVILIFVLVLTTNLIDKDSFNKLRHSVTTIYEDRVVASNLIFEMTILIQEKEIALAISDSTFFKAKNDTVNQNIENLILRYEKTRLTNEEEEIFDQLKQDLNKLKELEKKYANSGSDNNIAVFKSIDDIVHNLYNLSKVQLKEGRKQMLLSNKTMETIDLFTQVE